MIELSKCPNCAETDKVTIAGKVFCIKCGSPVNSEDPPATQPISQADPAAATQPTQPTQPTQTQSFASVQKFQDKPVQAPVDTAEPAKFANDSIDQITPPSPPQNPTTQTLTVPNDEPVAPISAQNLQTTSDTNTSQLDDQINSLSQQQPVNTGEPVAPLSTTSLQSTPPAANNPAVTDSQSVAPLDGQQPSATPNHADQVPLHASQTQATQPNPISDITPPSQPLSRVSEHVGSEIMSLDKKEPGVFSDDQLNQLAKITSEPTSMPKAGDSVEPTQPNQNPAVESTNISEPVSNVITPPPSPRKLAPMPNATTQDIKPVGKPAGEPPAQVANSLQAKSANERTLSNVMDDINKNDKSKDITEKTKKGLKPASIALTIVALFLVGAYIWQVNYPNLAFKIASAKAGINASLPGYVPSGWKMLGEIQTSPGTVTYNLVNPDNSKKIQISQTKTDWDSQALAENYVAPKAENYLALQSQGLTIYVYGNNQAAWVNKGTWYKIETSDQSLTQDQMIKIATSL